MEVPQFNRVFHIMQCLGTIFFYIYISLMLFLRLKKWNGQKRRCACIHQCFEVSKVSENRSPILKQGRYRTKFTARCCQIQFLPKSNGKGNSMYPHGDNTENLEKKQTNKKMVRKQFLITRFPATVCLRKILIQLTLHKVTCSICSCMIQTFH